MQMLAEFPSNDEDAGDDGAPLAQFDALWFVSLTSRMPGLAYDPQKDVKKSATLSKWRHQRLCYRVTDLLGC